jgi:hypothetical protein
MISSDIEKKKPNITSENVKDVGGRIEDKAAEGKRGTELQSEKSQDGTNNMEGAVSDGAGMA